MESLWRKAIVVLLTFVGLSVTQRLTGVGSQPQLVCQISNAFHMNTLIKRNAEAIKSPSTKSNLFDNLDICKLFQKWSKRAASGSTSGSPSGGRGCDKGGLKSLVNPFRSFFGIQDDEGSSFSESPSSTQSSLTDESD